jgi:hypothetical protein
MQSLDSLVGRILKKKKKLLQWYLLKRRAGVKTILFMAKCMECKKTFTRRTDLESGGWKVH